MPLPLKSAQRQKQSILLLWVSIIFICHDDHVTAEIWKYNDTKTKEKVNEFVELSNPLIL